MRKDVEIGYEIHGVVVSVSLEPEVVQTKGSNVLSYRSTQLLFYGSACLLAGREGKREDRLQTSFM